MPAQVFRALDRTTGGLTFVRQGIRHILGLVSRAPGRIAKLQAERVAAQG